MLIAESNGGMISLDNITVIATSSTGHPSILFFLITNLTLNEDVDVRSIEIS